jgi:hypothetical protein
MNMLKTEEAIKNRKFRYTWQHTTNKTTNTTQYVLDTAIPEEGQPIYIMDKL